MSESEIEYARRRTAEELEQADGCADSNVAHVHRRLAILYANMVAELHHLIPCEVAGLTEIPRPPPFEMPLPPSTVVDLAGTGLDG